MEQLECLNLRKTIVFHYKLSITDLQEFNAKLSGFRLAKDGPEHERTHVSTAVRGTSGDLAPEYAFTGYMPHKQMSIVVQLNANCYYYPGKNYSLFLHGSLAAQNSGHSFPSPSIS